MNDSQTITISSTPADVPVSDDRGTVKGADVTIASDRMSIANLVIPREGGYLGCWLDDEFVLLMGDLASDVMSREGLAGFDRTLRESDLVDDLIGHAADCADLGASGEPHSVTVSITD